MELGHDSVCALATIVDLVNTSPTVTGEETLCRSRRAARSSSSDGQVSEPGRLTATTCPGPPAAQAAARHLPGSRPGQRYPAGQRTGRRRADDPAPDRPRRMAAAHPLLRAGRPARRAPGRRRRDGPGLRHRGRRVASARDLRRPRLRPGAGRPLAQPLQALLRRAHLRQPAACRGLPRPAEDRLTTQ